LARVLDGDVGFVRLLVCYQEALSDFLACGLAREPREALLARL
jgi:hypothetical protein